MPENPHPPVLSTTSPPQDIAAAIEAVLMSMDRPLTASALADGLFAPPALHRADKENGDSAEDAPRAPKGAEVLVKKAIESLNESYAQSSRSFRIEPVAGGYRVMTLPQHGPIVAAFHRSRQDARLSKAAVETLAIIAYKQPITRATLEAIRGVACGEVLRTLVDRKLITIKGRAEELGRPLLYGTTKQFLDAFGLASLTDLPSTAELKPLLSAPAPDHVGHQGQPLQPLNPPDPVGR